MSGASARRDPGARHRGHPSNYTNLCDEPADHALGRSRGGLTTQDPSALRRAADCHWSCSSALAMHTIHRCSSPLMGQLRVPRLGAGRPRTRPGSGTGVIRPTLRRAHRACVCAARGICAVIPEQSTQIDHRRRPRQPRRAPGRPRRPKIQAPQRHRTILQHRQELARAGHPLRQTRPHLPRRSSPRRDLCMATAFKRHAQIGLGRVVELSLGFVVQLDVGDGGVLLQVLHRTRCPESAARWVPPKVSTRARSAPGCGRAGRLTPHCGVAKRGIVGRKGRAEPGRTARMRCRARYGVEHRL